MKILNDIAFLGVDSMRSRAYLSLLHSSGLLPSSFIFLDIPGPETAPISSLFDTTKPAKSYAEDYGLPVTCTGNSELNCDATTALIESSYQSTFIFSGPPGGLVKKDLLATGKRFLHIHPGTLPEYRGSTTIYYSLLKEGFVGASALLLDANIDEGPVVGTLKFPAPTKGAEDLDRIYDPWVRATLLRDVLIEYSKCNHFKINTQKSTNACTFFVIHPVLKTIAVNSLSTDKE